MLHNLFILILIIILNTLLFKNNFSISAKLNLFDRPDKIRKLHSEQIPLNGGIFFFLNILVIFSCDYFFNDTHITTFFGFQNEFQILFFILISFFLLSLGIIDDKISLKPLTKTFLSIVLFGSFLIINKNFYIIELRFESFNKVIDLFNMSFIFTIACFATLQIALNMYDGINLQSSFYYIILVMFFFIVSENYGLKLFCFFTFVYLIFFSNYNFKERIFLGDNGVYLFSFIFSLIIINVYNTTDILFVESILIILLFPFLDLIRLFLIRLKKNQNPFEGDRNHIQHILIKKYGLIKSNLILISPIVISMILLYKTNINLLIVLFFKFLIYVYLINQRINVKY